MSGDHDWLLSAYFSVSFGSILFSGAEFSSVTVFDSELTTAVVSSVPPPFAVLLIEPLRCEFALVEKLSP